MFFFSAGVSMNVFQAVTIRTGGEPSLGELVPCGREQNQATSVNEVSLAARAIHLVPDVRANSWDSSPTRVTVRRVVEKKFKMLRPKSAAQTWSRRHDKRFRVASQL